MQLLNVNWTKEQKEQFLAGCQAFRNEIPNFETPLDAAEQTFLSFEADAPDTPFQMGFLQEAWDVGCNEVDPQDH